MSKSPRSLRCQILVLTATKRQIKYTVELFARLQELLQNKNMTFALSREGGIKFSGFSEGLTPDLYPMVYIIGSKK